MLTPLTHYLTSHGMTVTNGEQFSQHPTLHITTADNNTFQLTVYNHYATVESVGRIRITEQFTHDVLVLDVAKTFARKLYAKDQA